MAKNDLIHIGTSGWNFDHWKKTFYPENIKSNEMFEYYRNIFDTVEINNTFYNLPEEKTLEKWKNAVSESFLFSVKASRYITHMKKLKDPDKSLPRFFERIKILKDNLGPILFQCPPNWRVNTERLEAFLDALSDDYRYTFEFRDPSWFDEKVYRLLKKKGAAFCIYDLEGRLSPKEITSDFIYLRLHGPAGNAYQGSYDTQALSGWAGAFSTWSDMGKEIFCYFDNDEAGYAAQNAAQIKKMIG